MSENTSKQNQSNSQDPQTSQLENSEVQQSRWEPTSQLIQRAKLNPALMTSRTIMQLQRTIGNQAVQQLLAGKTQRKTNQEASFGQYAISPLISSISQRKPSEKAAQENNTGLPDNLKAGVETLSGLSMDDVEVHYNSSEPAKMASAAYTEGADIHVGPGQEDILPHEAWHVVQQKEGRVTPSIQMKSFSANFDSALENDADRMGEKAATLASRLPSATQSEHSSQLLAQPLAQRSGTAVRQFGKCGGGGGGGGSYTSEKLFEELEKKSTNHPAVSQGICDALTTGYLAGIITPEPGKTGITADNIDMVIRLKEFMVDQVTKTGATSSDIVSALVRIVKEDPSSVDDLKTTEGLETLASKLKRFDHSGGTRTIAIDERFYIEFSDNPVGKITGEIGSELGGASDIKTTDMDGNMSINAEYEENPLMDASAFAGHQIAVKWTSGTRKFDILDQNTGLASNTIAENEDGKEMAKEIAAKIADHIKTYYIDNPMPVMFEVTEQGEYDGLDPKPVFVEEHDSNWTPALDTQYKVKSDNARIIYIFNGWGTSEE